MSIMQRYLRLRGTPNPGFVLYYSILSEDHKQAWHTIIAALISVVTTNDIKVVRIYLSSTFLRMIY